jgi:two-component system OmpR family sensor kinase
VLHRLSLRARLLLGVFVLAAAGLVAADIATYSSLRSFLLNRVDKTLQSSHAQVEHFALGDGGQDHGTDGGRHGNGPPAQGIDWYQVRTPAGTVLSGGFIVGGGSPPKLPGRISLGKTEASGPTNESVSYFTVGSQDGTTTYRARASSDPTQPSRVLVVASSLDDVYGTLHRLLVIELLVTAAVLAAIAGLGLWVVRLGLRPLRQIEATAATIAAGDLSERVERAEPRTEVGRLGLSLNAMLSQIESAFRAREESEAKLRQSDQKLRQFVADASHELRTPLAAVRAYAELFGRGAAARPEDLARSMSGITRESERMSLLVEDLLVLARLDEGRPLEQEPVDLAVVVGDGVDAARVVEPGRAIDVMVEPAWVVGDRARLRQVIDNLFTNVRAHTPPGTPVSVDLRRVNGKVELRVADSGPGLDDEQAGQVFERFYRVDSARTRANGGVGLGLSIVAAIAHAHGGSAEVQPTPGGGATFVVCLPVAARGAARSTSSRR